MKSAEQIEQSLRRLNVEAGTAGREQTLRDLAEVHARHKENLAAAHHGRLRRTIMTCGTRRVAAAIGIGALLIGVLGLGTGSVAFSQAGHAINTTLAWLRQAVIGPMPGEPSVEAPTAPERIADTDSAAVCYAARFFPVPEEETGVWRSLQDQGIKLIKVSTDPEVYYAALTRAQAESFDASVALRCLSAPRVTVSAGTLAMMALTDSDPQKGRQGFALGLLPVLSSGHEEIQSTISFHDGHNGFEIPNVSTESGGVVLIRVKGILSDPDEATEFLIRIQINVQ